MKKGIKSLGIFIVLCLYTVIGFGQNDSIIFLTTQPLCYGNCNGSISASVTGTNAPYSFLWSNGATTNSTSGLCANDYTLSVTNNNAVTTTSVVTLGQPSQLGFYTYCGLNCWQAMSQTTICINNIIGGTPPYVCSIYDVNNNIIFPNFWCALLPQGAYNIIVSDSNNCQVPLYGNYIILDSTNCNTTFSSPTCTTCCDGVVQLNFTNPCPSCTSTLEQAGITYTSSTNTFTNVCLGSYTITAINYGCSSVIIDTLSRPATATSINKLSAAKDFELFPNPTAGIIKIKYTPIIEQITILNPLGIIVKKISIENPTSTTIDLSNFAKGIYLIQFSDQEKNILNTKKIILE